MDIFLHPIVASYYHQSPLVLVNVGASGGLPRAWRRATRYLHVVGFEPDPTAFAQLSNEKQANDATYLNIALLDRHAVVPFHLTRRRQCSSIFQPNRALIDNFINPARFDIEESGKLTVDTLDHQLEIAHIDDVDFIKLDAQGAELAILKGSVATLAKGVFGLALEVEFAPVYQDQPLFGEVDSFLRSSGFQLFDLKPYYWKRARGQRLGGPRGQLMFADALYLRTESSFESLLVSGEPSKRKARLLKGITICALYGYLDYAAALLRLHSDILTDEENHALNGTLHKNVPFAGRIPNLRGRTRLARFLGTLARALGPADRELDRDLGNVN